MSNNEYFSLQVGADCDDCMSVLAIYSTFTDLSTEESIGHSTHGIVYNCELCGDGAHFLVPECHILS